MFGKIFRLVRDIFIWIYVQIFKIIYYDKVYFSSKYFRGFRNQGWIIAAEDIHNRIWKKKHRDIKWPVSPNIDCGANIEFDIDDLNNFWGSGNYFQTIDAKIVIGKGTWIAKNVGIVTSNHDLKNLDVHQKGKDVLIGKKCWLGMNCVILPGVILGDNTVVGAGAVVTHSFPEGNCVIGGNPAKIIRRL